MKESGVYMFQSILYPERVYIGSTTDLISRRWVHLKNLRVNTHHSSKLQNHINKYGIEDLEFSILESGEYFNSVHLLSREQGWFIPYLFRGTEKPYFNMTKIAGSTVGVKKTEEQCRKSGEANIGNKYRLGSYPSKETREKQRKAKLGKTAWNKGKIVDEVWGNKKSILQYDLKMNFIQEWNSAFDAARGLSIIPNHIYSVMKGERKSACGFIWKYKNNINEY